MSDAITRGFLGVGWAHPLSTDPVGDVNLAQYEDDIRQAVQIILGTASGERVMRPDFGCGLYKLTFEPINQTTMALARHAVEEALVTWEPRIDKVTVGVREDGARGQLLIDINYRVRSTNTFYNLVYPFYLSEARTT